jgi:2-polyprenyl-3-methyl-5-hydroxy-6-metoxy-1,4-benzoquinol methylase
MKSKDTVKFSQYSLYGSIYKCQNCNFVIEERGHDVLEIAELLRDEEYGDELIGQLNLQEKSDSYAPLINIIENRCGISGSNLLDVGANTGVFLNLARDLGAKPFGLEPSLEATEIAKSQFDLNIQNGVISDIDIADESIDVITMWDVVEHLYDPVSDLAALLPKLKHGGHIFIGTHDIDNILCRLWGKRNPLLMYQHFYHFSPITLNKALLVAGYEVAGSQVYHKSWSISYLLALFEKLWPDSSAAKFAGATAAFISPVTSIGGRRIRFPIDLFFVGIGRRA